MQPFNSPQAGARLKRLDVELAESGDCWPEGDRSSISLRLHEAITTTTTTGKQRGQQHQPQHNHLAHYRQQRETVQPTPRIPRGVSKIPRQVNGGENSLPRCNQQDSMGASEIGGSNSKYLTFSKDQATSHFKSLKEELNGQTRESVKQESEGLKTSAKVVIATERPKPSERQSKVTSTTPLAFNNINAKDTDNVAANLFSSAVNFRHQQQQPICEAFIMTGQSMLKLSCNESENNTNNNKIPVNHLKQAETRLRAHSLNKLNSENSNLFRDNDEQINQQKQRQQQASIESPLLLVKQPIEVPAEEDHPQLLEKTIEVVDETEGDATVASTGTQTEPFAAPELEGDNSRAIAMGVAGAGIGGGNSASSTDSVAHQTAAIKQQPSTTKNSNSKTDLDNSDIGIEICQASSKRRQQQQQLALGEPVNLKDQEEKLVVELVVANKQAVSATQYGDIMQTSEQTDGRQNREPDIELGDQERQKEQQEEDELAANNLANLQTCQNDRDSARRLAKRLYNLSGFKRSDVCHHLAKNNPFSQMVAEEYLNLFDFRAMKLDSALRKFLSKLQLNGETQERERMLSQYSQRYYDCNKDKFPSADTVQTLVCALILLNTDLHGGHNKKKRSKLSLGAFIDGLNNSIATPPRCSNGSLHLQGSNPALNGTNSNAIAYAFPRHLLIDLYESIKKRPLKCGEDKCDMSSFEAELDKIYNQQIGNNNRSNTLPTRRFAPGSNAPSSTLSASSRRHLKHGLSKLNNQDDSDATIEFKGGYLNRKRVFEAHGRPTSKGRRGWRRVFVSLQDLRMIMRFGIREEDTKQQAKSRAQMLAQDLKNAVRIHHTFAKRSTTYTKREFVFHLKLADQSEYLIQANNEQDMTSWIDTINFASACLSSPALPSAISNCRSQQQHSQRPLLPSSYTKLSYWEQLIDHEERLQRLKVELDEHLSEAPNTKKANKRSKTEFIDKIAYLKHDIERYTVYVDLMRKKSNSPEAIILSKHPQIASLTPSDQMIKSLPSFAPPQQLDADESPGEANQP